MNFTEEDVRQMALELAYSRSLITYLSEELTRANEALRTVYWRGEWGPEDAEFYEADPQYIARNITRQQDLHAEGPF